MHPLPTIRAKSFCALHVNQHVKRCCVTTFEASAMIPASDISQCQPVEHLPSRQRAGSISKSVGLDMLLRNDIRNLSVDPASQSKTPQKNERRPGGDVGTPGPRWCRAPLCAAATPPRRRASSVTLLAMTTWRPVWAPQWTPDPGTPGRGWWARRGRRDIRIPVRSQWHPLRSRRA